MDQWYERSEDPCSNPSWIFFFNKQLTYSAKFSRVFNLEKIFQRKFLTWYAHCAVCAQCSKFVKLFQQNLQKSLHVYIILENLDLQKISSVQHDYNQTPFQEWTIYDSHALVQYLHHSVRSWLTLNGRIFSQIHNEKERKKNKVYNNIVITMTLKYMLLHTKLIMAEHTNNI